MKFLFAIIALLGLLFVADYAHASGKITVQNNFFNKGADYRPMIGLQIYETIWTGRLAFNSWTGYGNQPFDVNPDVNWFTTKNQIDVYYKRFTLSPGYQFSFVSPWKEQRDWVYLKLDYKLW